MNNEERSGLISLFLGSINKYSLARNETGNKIVSPGKFEACAYYVPYYYEVSLEDYVELISYDDGSSDTYVELTPLEQRFFAGDIGLMGSCKYIVICESSNGFISHTFADTQSLENARQLQSVDLIALE